MSKELTPNDKAIIERAHDLQQRVRKAIPAFAQAVDHAMRKRLEAGESPLLVQHQDAFAGDYQMNEYLLLGMAIKYAGLYGLELRIIGRNRETVDKPI